MAQYCRARFVRGLAGNSAREHITYSSQARVSEVVMTVIDGDDLAVLRARPFSDDQHSIAWTLRWLSAEPRLPKSIFQELKNALVSKRMFRYQNNVRLTGNAGPQRQMSRMAAHHFYNLHPTMRARRRSRSFDYFGYVSQGRVKTQSIVCAGDVLVDGLRNSDNAHAQLREFRCYAKSVFASADYDCIKSQLGNIFDYLTGPIFKVTVFSYLPERIGPRGTQISAAIAIPSPHRCAIQRQNFRQRIHQAPPPVE